MKFIIILGASLILCSCGGSTSPDRDVELQNSSKTVSSTGTIDTLNNAARLPGFAAPNTLASPEGSKVMSASSNNSGAALNPAHGQPGHTCDLPVGAPLNSPKQKVEKNSLGQITGTGVATKAGLNPPHGQPGHRCDLAVGASLASAPKTTAPAQPESPVVTNTAQTSGLPFSVSKLPEQSVVPPTNTAGVNPAHGQPGHKCELAVGAPLNSTNKKDSIK